MTLLIYYILYVINRKMKQNNIFYLLIDFKDNLSTQFFMSDITEVFQSKVLYFCQIPFFASKVRSKSFKKPRQRENYRWSVYNVGLFAYYIKLIKGTH